MSDDLTFNSIGVAVVGFTLLIAIVVIVAGCIIMYFLDRLAKQIYPDPKWVLGTAVDYIQDMYNPKEYTIIGSSALLIHLTPSQNKARLELQGKNGLPHDIDITAKNIGICKKETIYIDSNDYTETGPMILKSIPIVLDIWDIDMVKGQDNWWDNYNQETLENAETYTIQMPDGSEQNIRVASLEQIVKLKKHLNRSKDRRDLAFIKEIGLI